jgi:hypothetical protein
MLKRTVRWRSLEHSGLEHLDIEESAAGYRVRSSVTGEFEGYDYGAFYELTIAPDWTFRSLDLRRTDGGELSLRADGRGYWTDGDDRHLPEFDGCIDIDISATPFTNTLPIRRLRLGDGASQHLRITWVPMDTLQPFVDEQIYSKIDASHWHYAAADGSFDADIVVDADGLVVDYPPLFARI